MRPIEDAAASPKGAAGGGEAAESVEAEAEAPDLGSAVCQDAKDAVGQIEAMPGQKRREKKPRRHTTGELLRNMGLSLRRWGGRQSAGGGQEETFDDTLTFHTN